MLNKSSSLLLILKFSQKLSCSLCNNMNQLDVRFSKLINFTYMKSDKYSTFSPQLKK